MQGLRHCSSRQYPSANMGILHLQRANRRRFVLRNERKVSRSTKTLCNDGKWGTPESLIFYSPTINPLPLLLPSSSIGFPPPPLMYRFRSISREGGSARIAPSLFRTSPSSHRCCLSTSRYLQKRASMEKKIQELPEIVQQKRLVERLKTGDCPSPPAFFKSFASPPRSPDPQVETLSLEASGMSSDQFLLTLDAAFATCCLHVESRIAALLGEAPAGLVLRDSDPGALHYRHVAVAIARQLRDGKPLEDVLLDRARGYTVSLNDPVTSGRHCAIGGGPSDFVVTSTLASQCPSRRRQSSRVRSFPHHFRFKLFKLQLAPASKSPRFPRDAISFVSVGDGSVNNAHFLSAMNTAEYAQARKYKCPVLFAVSDNDICISLHGFGWLGNFLKRLHMPVYEAVGLNILDVHRVTQQATEHVRNKQRPALIVYRDLPRRFAHSGNDREEEYRTKTEIAKQQEANVIAGACFQATQLGVATYEKLHDRYIEIMEMTKVAFDKASAEDKNTDRKYLVQTNSAPLVPVTAEHIYPHEAKEAKIRAKIGSKGDVMRKLMNATIDEALALNPETIYIGEDVGYGGYYKVTDGLSSCYPHRVQDFPPDETSLIGAAIGLAQVGLVPILEIPYAKYLDCGADMFFEAAIMYWLSNGTCPNGMMIRLQGFGPGRFGGNFHTHNSLHMPPGIDVVCYSNGSDYARGWRYAMEQVKAGRVVMSVDCTDLLNRRHIDLEKKDNGLICHYPEDDWLPFSSVIVRDPSGKRIASSDVPPDSLAVVTYGTGVVEALQLGGDVDGEPFYVIETPLLSDVPQELEMLMPNLKAVLFADICKDGGHPYATTVTRLKAKKLLPDRWECVAATPTYNPLGTTLTFTEASDIQRGLQTLNQ